MPERSILAVCGIVYYASQGVLLNYLVSLDEILQCDHSNPVVLFITLNKLFII